jgi:hypothetical protein
LSDGSKQDRQEFGTDIGEVRHEPKPHGWSLRLYVLAVVCFPFLLIVGTIVWMSLPVYANRAHYAYLADTGYGMRLKHADCDVVVYGDSTALVGIEPKVIEERTGLKTCNLAEVAGVQMVNGLIVLDTYLKNNRAPQFIVFNYAPENLTPATSWKEVSTFEGDFFALKYRSDAVFWRTFLSEPNELITDAELGFRTGVQWLFTPKLPASLLQIRDSSHGRVPEPAPLLTACPAVIAERTPDAAWLASLRQKYGTDGTKVLIDVTPMPPCDPSLAFYRQRLTPAVIDNSVGTLQLGMYTDSGRLHTTDAGAAEISQRIAEQILRAKGSMR